MEIEKSNQRKKVKEKHLQVHTETYLYPWDAVDEDELIDYDMDIPF